MSIYLFGLVVRRDPDRIFRLFGAMKRGLRRLAIGMSPFRGLTPRQRILAVVLIALVIAAGAYRWAVFGNLNRLHGGSSAQTLTGESAVFVTKPEVEEDARKKAKGEGDIRYVSCREIATDTWECSVHFTEGRLAVYRGVWHESKETMQFTVLHRKTAVSFKG